MSLVRGRVRPIGASVPPPVTYEIDAPPRPAAGRSLPSWPTAPSAARVAAGRCGRRSSTTPATRSWRPRRPPPARPRSACTWPTGCSPRGACRAWPWSRRRRTSAASGRWTPRATASSWSRTGPTRAGPEPRDRHGVAVTYATVAAGLGGAPPPLRGAADAADRRRAAPHGRGRDVGALDGRRVRARAVPAAALGDAVPLGQLADPVGRRTTTRACRAPTTTTATRRRWSTACAGR